MIQTKAEVGRITFKQILFDGISVQPHIFLNHIQEYKAFSFFNNPTVIFFI